MFYKNVHIGKGHEKEMFNFIKSHFTYFTYNNYIRTIANNVKVYNLPFTNKDEDVLQYLTDTNYCAVNQKLIEWEEKHKPYTVNFNGRQAGYLILQEGEKSILHTNSYIFDWDDYESFKEYAKELYGTVSCFYEDLRPLAILVRDFDKLCDDLVKFIDTEVSKTL